MNLWELASGPIIPASPRTPPQPTKEINSVSVGERKKKRRKGGGGNLLFSFLVEINFSQGDKAIFILREGNKAVR